MKMKPSHPGEILSEDILKPMGLSITEADARHGRGEDAPGR